MTARPLTLADGSLTNARQVIYTVPDGMVTRITWVSFLNEDGSSRNCSLYIRRLGESRRVARFVLDASGGFARAVDRDEEIILSEGDALEAGASAADVISYTVAGVEEPDPDAA